MPKLDEVEITYLEIDSELEIKLDYLNAYISPLMEFYSRSPSMKDYTPHGKFHTLRVIEILNKLFSNIEFSVGERYLLYVASWVHDLGCLIDRDDHAKKSASLIYKFYTTFEALIGEVAAIWIPYIVSGHSKEFDIDDIPEEIDLFGDKDVRLQFITAIFRLADGCDVTRARVPKRLYEILKDDLGEGKEHWEAHTKTLDIRFEKDEIKVYFENSDKNELILKLLHEEYDSVSDTLNKYGISFEITSEKMPEMPKI